jgi:hypothetical protein
MKLELFNLGEKVGDKSVKDGFKKEMDNFFSLYKRFLEEGVEQDEL